MDSRLISYWETYFILWRINMYFLCWELGMWMSNALQNILSQGDLHATFVENNTDVRCLKRYLHRVCKSEAAMVKQMRLLLQSGCKFCLKFLLMRKSWWNCFKSCINRKTFLLFKNKKSKHIKPFYAEKNKRIIY